ncbi:MAG: Holliday junction resolvase RuvX [Planctomycetes bacterium]|nr:Holliday junction resolvase RuvX [Planctomycetota bacterium]
MAVWIGVDYGVRRIGIALGDHNGRIASPAATLDGTGQVGSDADRVLHWARDYEVVGFVVGFPLNMDGSEGAQAKLSKELADRLRQSGDAVVELWDERLTTFEANTLMRHAGVRKSRRERFRDAFAAQIILQSFLDARQPPASDTTDDLSSPSEPTAPK